MLIILKKIPAGLMIFPMLLGMLIHTFCPNIVEIGSFTTATFSNTAAATIMGVQLLCIGSQLQIIKLQQVVKRGGILLLSKLLLGVFIIVSARMIGGKQEIADACILAVLCGATNINGSIYLSLVTAYGDEIDGAAVALLSLTNGPFVTMILLGAAGMVHFSAISLAATIMPIVVGIVLGNLSKTFREFLKPGVQLLLPFIGWTLGMGIDLNDIFRAGISGTFLSIFVIAAGSVFTYLCDCYVIKRPGYAGLATCATGANAIAVPAAIAMVDSTWLPYVGEATAQIAATVVMSAIVVPIIVGIFIKKERKNNVKECT
ncbi:MAG: 2-keto-3-deoxygluconate permease [Lachnospiraceae bacterium]|nr:2-keto-3-deoxygluconate permease [Lachnospiraceae bacterium]